MVCKSSSIYTFLQSETFLLGQQNGNSYPHPFRPHQLRRGCLPNTEPIRERTGQSWNPSKVFSPWSVFLLAPVREDSEPLSSRSTGLILIMCWWVDWAQVGDRLGVLAQHTSNLLCGPGLNLSGLQTLFCKVRLWQTVSKPISLPAQMHREYRIVGHQGWLGYFFFLESSF
jgi:hypothetical protein